MRAYVWTFAALLALTGLTFGLSYLSLGVWGPVLGMGIALVKSLLVALFFMHLVEHRVSSRLAIGVAAALAACLVAFAMLDVETRAGEPAERSSVGAAGSP